jgi:hypothetical protein
MHLPFEFAQVIHIFRAYVLGGVESQALVGSHAHLQECGDDALGPLDGHLRLAEHSYGPTVFQQDA